MVAQAVPNRARRVLVWIAVGAMLATLAVTTQRTARAAGSSLAPFDTESGKISQSVDGNGNNDPAGGTLRVQKNAGATVSKAFLLTASTGFTAHTVADGDTTLNGTTVHYTNVIPNDIQSFNGLADVTDIVKPLVDPAPAGIISIPYNEPLDTFAIDGSILDVILNDPTRTTDNTVVSMFGAQAVAGDTFHITYGAPLNTSDPQLGLDMSLGISYSFQPPSGPCAQFSVLKVNGQPLSASAGGQDDGQNNNGTLITVGGIGDSNANPANPTSSDCPAGPRTDDELYSLLPFVKTGDTSTTVSTLNPSNDDNIYFAAFNLSNTSAIVGQGIVLSPISASNTVGQSHTVTATVTDSNGNPIANQTVTFTITSGPNAGLTGSGVTDASGHATFTYTSSKTGTDTIQASFVNSLGQTITSNSVTKTWVAQGDTTPPTCNLINVGINASGQKFITVAVQDSGSGIQSINLSTTNATVSTQPPSFSAGFTGELDVTATKVNQSAGATLSITVTDAAGNVTVCDPTLLEASRVAGQPSSQTIKGLAKAESKVHVRNDSKGISNLRLTVNGKVFELAGLRSSEQRSLDVSSAMHAGNDNTVVLTALGAPGSTVFVLLSD
jgi:Bacterial Ig-like domain (group 1)